MRTLLLIIKFSKNLKDSKYKFIQILDKKVNLPRLSESSLQYTRDRSVTISNVSTSGVDSSY